MLPMKIYNTVFSKANFCVRRNCGIMHPHAFLVFSRGLALAGETLGGRL